MYVKSTSRSKLIVAAALLLCAPPLHAQQNTELRESQQRLEKIRQERQQLQAELEALKSRVRDASREAQVIARQRATSESAMRELDYQAEVINANVDSINGELTATHMRLTNRTQALNERLRSIYKRGKLHTVRVLLSAESFGDVLRRYKYLHLIALNDKMMVSEVKDLELNLQRQEQSCDAVCNSWTTCESRRTRSCVSWKRSTAVPVVRSDSSANRNAPLQAASINLPKMKLACRA